MDDLLKPVKTVKKIQSNIEKFESLSLNNQPLRQENRPPKSNVQKSITSIFKIDSVRPTEPLLEISNAQPVRQEDSERSLSIVRANEDKIGYDSEVFIKQSYLRQPALSSLSDNAREILRNQPNREDLVAVLKYLQYGIEGCHDFNVRKTSPQAAQIVNVLVSVTIPDIWTVVKQKEISEDEACIKTNLLSSLSSAAGIGALLAQIQYLSTSRTNANILNDSLLVLADILGGPKTIYGFLQDVRKIYEKETDRRLFWQEVTTLMAGSRVLSIAAQALSSGDFEEDSSRKCGWLGNGPEYSAWLAKNVVFAATKMNTSENEAWKLLSQVVRRGMSLGHRAIFVGDIYSNLLLAHRALWTPLQLILKQLASHEQKAFFDSIMFDLAQKHDALIAEPAMAFSREPAVQKTIAGAAALVAGLVRNNELLEHHMEIWLASGGIGSTMTDLPSRRALVAALGRSEVKLQRILEKALALFSENVQIQHASILHQEAIAQIILLLIGSISRINVQILKEPAVSTIVMRSVSNRLAASIPRARLLGMIIGTAFSRIIDKTGSTIDFGDEELQSEDAAKWFDLVDVNDHIGDITDLRLPSVPLTESKTVSAKHKLPFKPPWRKKPSMTSKVISIAELSESSESEEEELNPYQKPDSDPEDSDEDPTLVNRNKPSAPLYIPDMMKQLQMTETPDVVALALRNGPTLIRRKAGFGTELSDNVKALVTVLINLQEGMSEPDLQQLRLDCVIACLVALPDLIGPSLADVYFRGDFSISQRLAILTALGLGARELSGFRDCQQSMPVDNFPSRRLPAHLEPQSQSQAVAISNPIAKLTDNQAQITIQPMALAAADKMTGPSALKVRTFSSRMNVEKKSGERAAARKRAIPKNLNKLLTESIYMPLCSRMSLLLSHTNGGHLPNTTILHSSTFRLFLQTLTLVLHTLGPTASLHLPVLTHETLLLLLDLHTATHLSTDPALLPVLLHLLLALIDITIEAGVTAQERLITDHGTQVVELVNWSNSLGDRLSVPSAEEGQGGLSWTILAAAIQVKWFEIGRRFQGRMLGLTIDEMDQLSGT